MADKKGSGLCRIFLPILLILCYNIIYLCLKNMPARYGGGGMLVEVAVSRKMVDYCDLLTYRVPQRFSAAGAVGASGISAYWTEQSAGSWICDGSGE